MPAKRTIPILLLLILLTGLFVPAAPVRAADPAAALTQTVSAYELIIAMNTLRVSNGLPALVEDPIINAVAQGTAEIMAASQMSWHIGNVSGRLAAAGYGGGATVWGTENFAVGNLTIDEIMVMWADPSHMIPAVNPAYCNVGAGVARAANGRYYYVLQAAYVSGKACGDYVSPIAPPAPGQTAAAPAVPQIIIPVKIATPDADGKIIHTVEMGQSLWAIAVAYQITIRDIEVWNNISRETRLQVGQKLFIPGPNTEGYATPTPIGMIVASTPDADGRIVHTVQSHQTLTTISQAYNVAIQTILNLNGWQLDWPLQIGQKLLIHPGNITPSPTPRPLTPIERLTPAADGKYYHTVRSGETLSWIASLYEIDLASLMRWNGLNNASILQPDQQLLLEVTPPPTETPTPGPPSDTPTATRVPPTYTATATATLDLTPSPTETPQESAGNESSLVWGMLILAAGGGLFLAVFFSRKKAG